jgi:hypothetical protein
MPLTYLSTAARHNADPLRHGERYSRPSMTWFSCPPTWRRRTVRSSRWLIVRARNRVEARAVQADRRAVRVIRVEANRVAAGREVVAGREAAAVGRRVERVVAREARAAAREARADARVDQEAVSGETAPELQLVNEGGRARRAGPFPLTAANRVARCCHLHHIQCPPEPTKL